MSAERGTEKKIFLVGIDIGSTTTKAAVIDPETEKIVYQEYERHGSAQLLSVLAAAERLAKRFSGALFRVVMTGSGAKPVADLIGVPFIQEVVANSIAIRKEYEDVGTAIELGGQDAKMLFFGREESTGKQIVRDMRMNGSCAGGTGAFLDEVASILKVPIESLDSMAAKGDCVYDISGRCGVFAKTDIQPLLNQGVSRENLALSSFHAIAKQTIGGLAQGLEIRTPVIFEGGPLTFNPTLVRVFSERLELSGEDILIPEHPEIMVAYGAGLSLLSLFKEREIVISPEEFENTVREKQKGRSSLTPGGKPYFETPGEREDFEKRHPHRRLEVHRPARGETIRAYLGIDSGSTTTKFVLMDEEENILDSFYSPNGGNPLMVAKSALIAMRDRYKSAGADLQILACGTTGYGELLFNKAFETEIHVVETVAHARAAAKYVENASFILDIGGQDMKAIWLDHGIITNIVVNEACSSGCGSFLENFAASLHIPVKSIAGAAFSAKNPAVLGSRCTVFMNSSIITEQRNGRQADDIMAGLCRSIIENVFTKVIRISNVNSLGDTVVVQGGTFENDAVLRAMEQFIGREVIRAPYPGIMGAIGAALLTKDACLRGGVEKTFPGLDSLDSFSFAQEANSPCPFCANHCKRTIIRFSNGNSWITNNRCEKGEILGDPKDVAVKAKLLEKAKEKESVPNLYNLRQELLFKEYEAPRVLPENGTVIGLPRVLAYWDNMPFWRTFWTALGYTVKMSPLSTRKIYESGLSAVTSDTVCFPAKLVHGHLRTLEMMKVDRIFMPSVTAMPSENTEKHSESMCAVVKGYPFVIRNSDNPDTRAGVPFDAPLFHWYSDRDREKQLTEYMKESFGISPENTKKAIAAGDRAMEEFHRTLKAEGARVMEEVKKNGTFAVVLASRPYQNDALVNHDLPDLFVRNGVPVLTADSLPEINDVDLSRSRIDVVNNFHARMLSGAILAARTDYLEYVQVVSFGCGHDAYLSDEIIRLMKDISGKAPLVLKLDESDVQGPLRIRVRSFLETIRQAKAGSLVRTVKPLSDPYPVKFVKKDVEEKVVLVPNTSHAFCRIMSAAMAGQHLKAVPLPVGYDEAIRLGKHFVHNDICFPAQIVIGEALEALNSGKYDPDKTAVAMGKYIGDCRLTHYGALLRKALDDAGFSQVPILTNDDEDAHNMHPGFKMNLLSAARLGFAMPMIDAMEELLRKERPYELVPGSAEKAFEEGMDAIVEGLEQGGILGARKGFEKAIDLMKAVPYDRSKLRPTVLIVGEYLLNFHPGANHEIEKYLEKNGFEIIEAKMTDVIQKSYYFRDAQIREYKLKKPFRERETYHIESTIFNYAHDMTDAIACRHPLYEKALKMRDLVKVSDPILHHTFDAGEGILIPGEILHNAEKGCRNFIILQPFGCLPNHVVGRGIMKKLREYYPDAQILPLDYDPDVSFANIENRLQMLIMNAKNH